LNDKFATDLQQVIVQEHSHDIALQLVNDEFENVSETLLFCTAEPILKQLTMLLTCIIGGVDASLSSDFFFNYSTTSQQLLENSSKLVVFSF
jgi:hypothetical protein